MSHASRRPCGLVLVLALFAHCACAEQPAENPSPLDAAIRALEAKPALDSQLSVRLAQAYLQKAREAGDVSLYAKAEACLRKSIEGNPADFNALGSLASTLQAQHRFSEAAEMARKAVDLAPARAYAYGVLADALLELGQLDKAAEVCAKFEELAPSLAGYARTAQIQWLKGDLPAAIESMTFAIEDGQERDAPAENIAWCHVQLGGIHFGKGDLAKAEACYQDALKVFPDYYRAQEHIAELRAAEGKFEDAADLYRKVVARVPDPHFMQALGDVYLAARKPDEAKAWHDQALAAYLKHAEAGRAHYFRPLAMFYADTRPNPAEALKWARKDMETRQDIFSHDVLAWALYQNGDFAAAVESIAKALSAGTKDAHLFKHAGMIYFRAGDLEKSRAYMRAALETNPYFEKFHAHR